MAEPKAAAGVQIGDLGAYQDAVRLVLTSDLITAVHPRPGVLERVLPWADELTRDLRDLFGYTLIATTRHVRLIRQLDTLNPSRGKIFTTRAGKAFDRRRLAYLCLILGSFQRSRVEISLADLVRQFGPVANSIDGLGFDPLVPGHKGAVVDVLGWLVERGALSLSDGSVEAWARGGGGDALYDIDHDICAMIFRPPRPLQHLTSAAGLLDGAASVERRARRLLLERPVVYYSDVDAETAAVLQRDDVAENLARLTGLVVERRAEGVLLADPVGRFTDRPFPGRGGVVNRAAGLLIARIADLLEEGDVLGRVDAPVEAQAQQDLLARIDSALPESGVVRELAWSEGPRTPLGRGTEPLVFVERHTLEELIEVLYDQFGAASFTGTWQQDPHGLLDAAVTLLEELRLIRSVPGGVLVLPAALRYRNISLAIPAPPKDQLDLFDGDPK
ncbi:hypothetical protein GCM10023194_70710 [Planotetraspora phitsanulokensis]|uniref:TIGR02678 family protein n=1 Tax=Planotetraspora phitsanulokensis TaxID=575192 RepID=A0A8J3UH85_9ACTN|nr:DUF2398 family protein [Planotetraspora phitsanulokensis]GII43246.1 hypothetical protein Pph01_82490 [Planotetraspora phitsanulokensis]